MKYYKHSNPAIRIWFVCILCLLSPYLLSAETGKNEPDTKSMIFEHLQDSYWWYITTINKDSIFIYLPVIVRSDEGQWHLFSSSHIAHGETYKGFYISKEGNYEGKIVRRNAAGKEIRPLDISLTKSASALVLDSLIIIIIFLIAAGWYKRRPKHTAPGGFVGMIEMLVMSIEDDVVRKSIGKDYARYSPFILTAFFFVLINNLTGLFPVFPAGANTTGNIAVTITLALCTMLVVNLFANKTYWKEIFWPEVPLWMKFPIPLMPAIELFEIVSKPFALMIRLFANMMAGHTVMISLASVIFVTAGMGIAINASMTIFSVILLIFMNFLEILVAYIQAYVFAMLSAVFIGLSRPAQKSPASKEKDSISRKQLAISN